MAAITLKVGDRVAFVNEVGGGSVIEVRLRGRVVVRGDDGFELERGLKELVRYDPVAIKKAYSVTDHQAGMVAANDVLEEKRKKRFYVLSPGGVSMLAALTDEWRGINASLDKIL